MIDTKTLDNKKYKAIFCDIFDTVVYRKVQPEFTKKLWVNKLVKRLDLKISMIDLYNERSKIELALGERSHNAGYDWEFRYKDLSAEIYDYLVNRTDINISKKKFIELSREIEVEVESAVQVPNKDVINTIKKARKKGKKIYCVSDMYLSKNMVREIFENIGIIDLFDGIYISCEYLKNKKSGQLYTTVLNELKLKPEACIMIGDNKPGDFEIPTNLGIKAIHIDRTKQYEKYQKFIEEKENTDTYNEFMKLTKTPDENFEHAIFTLYKFIENLYYNLENDDLDEVFFLSREGEYLKKIFDDFNDKIYGKKIKSHYILVSRKATYLPSLKKIENEDFKVLLCQYLNSSIKEFLGSLNFTKEEINKILKSYQEDLNKFKKKNLSKFDKEALEKMRKGDFDYKVVYLYGSEMLKVLKDNKDFKKIYETNRKIQNELFKKYIKQYTNKKKICVVDVGWNGSIQDNIQNILGQEYQVTGYLYGLISRDSDKCKNKKGLIFSNVPAYTDNYELYGENRTIYEIILGASHGSANKYKEENGKVIATTFEKQEEKDIYKNVVSKIQDKMFKMFLKLEDLFENEYYDNLKIDKAINREHFRMLFEPTEEQLKFFNKIYHYENFGVFQFSKFNLKKELTLKFYIKENLKYILKRKHFFDDAFWPTLKLYNEKLYIPKFLYKMNKKFKLKRKGVL